MIILALDLAVIFVVVFCGWRGYKSGLIRGIFGIVTLVVAVFLASVIATAYSSEFTEMLSPFVGGVVDTTLIEIMEEGIETDPDDPEFESANMQTAYTVLRRIGLPLASSKRVAEMATDGRETDSIPAVLFSDIIADKLSSSLSYVAVFGIAFILLAIICAVIGNLVGVVFSLPGLRILDAISGAAFGILKGLLIVFALAAVIRYAGLLAPESLDATTMLKYVVNNNPIATRIGV